MTTEDAIRQAILEAMGEAVEDSTLTVPVEGFDEPQAVVTPSTLAKNLQKRLSQRGIEMDEEKLLRIIKKS
jgi:hypothetical protein